MKKILYIAIALSLVNYSLWRYFPEGTFYVLNALFITLLCVFIYLENRKSFVCWLLLMLSINNLADEFFFDATKLQLNELIFALSLPFIWVIKILRNDKQILRKWITAIHTKNIIPGIYRSRDENSNRNEKG